MQGLKQEPDGIEANRSTSETESIFKGFESNADSIQTQDALDHRSTNPMQSNRPSILECSNQP